MHQNAPITLKSTTLVVNDLDTMRMFYGDILGFDVLAEDATTCTLGADGRGLLTLNQDRHAQSFPSQAGLFHNAYLLPSRMALGSWIRHAADKNVRLTGASDHGVGEAVYLNDPEGNGIEIYADRPADTWTWDDVGQIEMNTTGLDLNELAGSAITPWAGAPEGTVLGHVHLQVGDIDALHDFMVGNLRQDLMLAETGARFYATAGYHHHFAGNIWNSRGAKTRDNNSTGLEGIVIETDGTLLEPQQLTDPWGTVFTLQPK